MLLTCPPGHKTVIPPLGYDELPNILLISQPEIAKTLKTRRGLRKTSVFLLPRQKAPNKWPLSDSLIHKPSEALPADASNNA